MTRAIGIDLGTTSTCVCVWQNDVAQVITNDEGNRFTPSYVSFTESGCLVGDAALRNTTRNPHNTVFNMKRLLECNFSDTAVQADIARLPFHVFDKDARPHIRVQDRGQTREFSPEEVLSFILAKIKEASGLHLGGVVTSATIAVPAHFNLSQRQAIKRAATIAGLDVRLISEAGACAIAYNLDFRAPIERNVLVFDLGGGCLDVSVLIMEDGIVEVKATASHPHLGGEDFDARLVDHFTDEFKRRHRKDISGNARALLRLRTQCERAKRALSSSSRSTIEVDCLFDNIDFLASITRASFEELCEDLFQSMLEPLRKVLRDAKLDKAQVHEIVLAGGSTRIPRIASLISAFFDGKQPRRPLNPDEAVARGAALHAALVAETGTPAGKAAAVARDLVLLERVPFSLGVEAAGGAMVPVITPNIVVPARRSVLFTTHADGQPGVFVQVYEGDRPRAQDNRLLGRFVLGDMPPARRGMARIEVTFDFGADEALVVSATDVDSGRSKRVSTADARRGLSEEEMARMCADAERHYREPVERAAAKERLKRYVSDARAALKELEGALNSADMWMMGAQGASKEEYEGRHRGVEAAAGSAMQKLAAIARADAEEASRERVVDERYLRGWQLVRA